jgi:hypothetical protein
MMDRGSDGQTTMITKIWGSAAFDPADNIRRPVGAIDSDMQESPVLQAGSLMF